MPIQWPWVELEASKRKSKEINVIKAQTKETSSVLGKNYSHQNINSKKDIVFAAFNTDRTVSI